VARNLTDGYDGFLAAHCCLVHDRDPLFTAEFPGILASSGVRSAKLPARCANLNAYAGQRIVLPEWRIPNFVVSSSAILSSPHLG
jgi:hypothetical protein